ncbi:uncharacterized protein LOC110988575 [Acanthaster planci]|uniref:Uncharacterized protein LOC110988575 n=1 Tax=Acanthaster planci TaxID=133434 RepID=A0A8B7ZQT4_ACAPL|nr:uncharacterized protein LOC110988575 [Acanthaster planci]
METEEVIKLPCALLKPEKRLKSEERVTKATEFLRNHHRPCTITTTTRMISDIIQHTLAPPPSHGSRFTLHWPVKKSTNPLLPGPECDKMLFHHRTNTPPGGTPSAVLAGTTVIKWSFSPAVRIRKKRWMLHQSLDSIPLVRLQPL